MHGAQDLTEPGRSRFEEVCTRRLPRASDHDRIFAGEYQSHRRAVHRLAVRICGPTHAADVTQEVFLRFWHDPDRFDPTRGPLRTFLLAVAHHKAIDALRAETARRAREHRSIQQLEVIETQADSALLQRESAGVIAAALDDLPGPERNAIVAAFYGHHSYREAAALLGVPEGTIKSRIRAGLKRLRVTLADHPGLTGAPD